MSSVFPSECRRLLQDHAVSEKQYMIWAMTRFRGLAFKSGLAITAVVAGLFGYIGYQTYRDSEDSVEGWIAFGIGLFFVLLFGGTAFSMRRGGPEYAQRSDLTEGHEMLDVARKTSPAFIKKLKGRDWEAIRRVDVKAYEVTAATQEAAKQPPAFDHDEKARIEYLQLLKKRMKKWGLWSLIPFTALVLTVPTYLSPLFDGPWWYYTLSAVLGAAVLVPLIGLHGWLFLHGYLGVKLRKIFVAAEWTEYDTIHRGKTAVVLGWVSMLAALVSFATFMLLFAGLFMVAFSGR